MTFLEFFASTANSNATGWADERFDELLDLSSKELDEAKQLEYLVEYV